jgi:uncharacterized protein (DUF427 family)
VRVQFNGEMIASSKHVQLLRESRHLPVYYFPQGDVRMDLLTPTETHTTCPYKGLASYWSIKVGDRSATDLAWSYLEPLPGSEAIAGHIAFYWNKVDHWYEEDEEIFKHPRDPYHRVDAMRASRTVKVVADGKTLAETDHPVLLFETGLVTRYYIPPQDVNWDLLEATDTTSTCPYKGDAVYWKVRGAERDIAWSYPRPVLECPSIRGLIAFFNERVDLVVDGQREERPVTPWSRR